MKYIDADKLIAEIDKKWKELADKNVKVGGGKYDIEISTYLSIKNLIMEVDLEAEIEKGWEELEKDYSPSALDKSYMIVSGLVGEKQFSRIARHFYELGKNSKK